MICNAWNSFFNGAFLGMNVPNGGTLFYKVCNCNVEHPQGSMASAIGSLICATY